MLAAFGLACAKINKSSVALISVASSRELGHQAKRPLEKRFWHNQNPEPS